jgi:tetratricopeptide (TPR) repeat protein
MQRALSYVSVILLVLLVFLPAHAEEQGGGAYYDLGVFAYEEGDYESAERYFTKALASNPDDPYYNHFLGKTYLETERYQKAMKYLNMAWKMNPDISGLQYDLAYLHYKMSKYSRAADLFAEIATEDPSNVLALYHAGICLYKQRDYQRALDYFLAAAQKSPTMKDNGYYYAGVCYWEMGKIDEAVEKFEYVRDHADSGLLRENALVWLGRIQKKEEKVVKPYSLYFKAGIHHDDNIPLDPVDGDVAGVTGDESGIVAKAYFSGKYNVVNRKDYQIGAGYSHYQTWHDGHDDLDEFDLIASIFKVYGKYRFQPFTLGLSYMPTYYWLDSDSYLRRHEIKPEVTWKCHEKLSTRLSYSYYADERFDLDEKDGHTNEGFLDAYYSILGKTGYLFGGIGYEDRDARHPDQDYGRLKTKLGIMFGIPWDLKVTLTGRYYDKEYDHTDSLFGKKREDSEYRGSVSISRKVFCDWLSAVAEYSYTENDSNIDAFEYDREVIGLSLTARY